MAHTKRDRDLWVQRISEARRVAKEKKSQRKSVVTNDAEITNQGGEQYETSKRGLSKANNGRVYKANILPTHQSPNMSCDNSPEIEQRPFNVEQTHVENGLISGSNGLIIKKISKKNYI